LALTRSRHLADMACFKDMAGTGEKP